MDTLGKLDVDAFYRRPGKDKRFFVQPVGVNKLGTIMKKMCLLMPVLKDFTPIILAREHAQPAYIRPESPNSKYWPERTKCT